MDTNTINYGLEKFGQFIEKITPGVVQVTEKLIKYHVTLAVMEPLAAIFVMAAVIIVGLTLLRIAKNKGYFDSDDKLMGTMLLVLACVVLFVWLSLSGFNAIVAVLNPEIYTLQKVLGSIKK